MSSYKIIPEKEWPLREKITPSVMKNLNELGVLSPSNYKEIAEQLKDFIAEEETSGILLSMIIGLESQKKIQEICGNVELLPKLLEAMFIIEEKYNIEDADAYQAVWAWNEFSILFKKK